MVVISCEEKKKRAHKSLGNLGKIHILIHEVWGESQESACVFHELPVDDDVIMRVYASHFKWQGFR